MFKSSQGNKNTVLPGQDFPVLPVEQRAIAWYSVSYRLDHDIRYRTDLIFGIVQTWHAQSVSS